MACICAFQKALSGVFLPNKSAGSECPMSLTSQVHKAFLRAIFRPSRAPAQCCSSKALHHNTVFPGENPDISIHKSEMQCRGKQIEPVCSCLQSTNVPFSNCQLGFEFEFRNLTQKIKSNIKPEAEFHLTPTPIHRVMDKCT